MRVPRKPSVIKILKKKEGPRPRVVSSIGGSGGAPGADGADGKSVLNGTGNPTSGIGVAGDFYINTTADTIFGPKTTVWGSGTSLVGPTGATGADGDDGAQGVQGETGLTGPAGEDGPTYTAGNGLTLTGTDFDLDAPEAWHVVGTAGEPSFQNSFSNYGSEFANVSFYKDALGIVRFQGAMKRSPTTTATALTLPSGYRPSDSVAIPVAVFLGVGTVTISAAGAVSLSSGSSAVLVDLSAVSFRVA